MQPPWAQQASQTSEQQAGKCKTRLYISKGLRPPRLPLWVFFWVDPRDAGEVAGNVTLCGEAWGQGPPGVLEASTPLATALRAWMSSAAALEARMSSAAALEARMSSAAALEARMSSPAALAARTSSPAALDSWRHRCLRRRR